MRNCIFLLLIQYEMNNIFLIILEFKKEDKKLYLNISKIKKYNHKKIIRP